MALIGSALRAGYGSRAVLDGVDLHIEAGRLLCLLGPNGAGKSTLARVLCGLLPPAARGLSVDQARLVPSVHVDGDSLAQLSPRARAQRIGFLPQEIEPSFSFRVDEAVELGARVAMAAFEDENLPGKRTSLGRAAWLRSAVDAALQTVDAQHLADRMLETLSGGERRRVLLASVLAQQPKYLLLDEPTAMLDLEHQVGLFEALRARCDAGLGVVVVTHDLNLAAQWADELVLLHHGKIAAQGKPQDVFVRKTLEQVFGPRFQLLTTPEGRPVIVPR